jgi:hypothetical protein
MTRAAVASLAERAQERIQVDRVVPTIPITRKASRTSVKLPDELWERLKHAAQLLSDEAKRDGREPLTRDDVMEHACRWWLQEWDSERKKKKQQ